MIEISISVKILSKKGSIEVKGEREERTNTDGSKTAIMEARSKDESSSIKVQVKNDLVSKN